ncbi:hypothetical protein OH773_13060 [Buttiauxella sp. WJP83]|uniref:hypothetical protein n=1 Tax=Buttiauxella sp. WJP83 TaxID=2986951 RepID=UPI0022DCF3BF|nr:hypothetical protein [Buttiauxella sp. WJP83]WBM69117.1 hypothetical protein OH773_13060 [Buttiauxella sp. WJP83]
MNIGSIKNSIFTKGFLLFVIFWMASSASFSGVMGKWALLDGQVRNGIENMLSGSAYKPFVYRQLAPFIANTIEKNTPEEIKTFVTDNFKPEKTFSKITVSNDVTLKFKYIIIYHLCFASILFSLFTLRKLLLSMGCSQISSIMSPILLALYFPYFLAGGGYFYDGIELLFMSLAVYLCINKKWLPLLVLTIPATLNKETFFFFAFTLYPLINSEMEKKKAIVFTLSIILISGIINIITKHIYANNLGGALEFHLVENIKAYFDYHTYIYVEKVNTYGIVGLGGTSLAFILLMFIIFKNGMPLCDKKTKQHIGLVTLISIPLFVLFSGTGEIRNLSFFLVSLAVLTGLIIDRYFLNQNTNTHLK